jgi:hypothetical protein
MKTETQKHEKRDEQKENTNIKKIIKEEPKIKVLTYELLTFTLSYLMLTL